MASLTAPQVWTVVICVLMGNACCEDISREKRDDHFMLTVTTIAEEPYVIVNSRPTINEHYRGLIPDMMSYIMDRLKFHYKFKLVADGKYGSYNDGKWVGMIGEILDGVADLAAAPMTISEDRKRVVDFTVPYESFGTVLLMLTPEDGSEPAIKNMDDLAKQTDVEYGIVRDGVTQNFFKSSNVETYKTIWSNIKKNPQNMVNKVEEGVEKVRQSNGKYVFIVESATAEYWVNKEPCNLMKVGDSINSNAFAFALKLGSQHKEKFDDIIEEMKNNGKMNELRAKWKQGKCGKTISTDPVSNGTPAMLGSGFMALLLAVCPL